MKTKLVFAFIFLPLVWTLPASAQGVLPEAFGSWSASGASVQVPAGQVEQFSSEHAVVLREYGLGGAERRQYASGPQAATVTLYNMDDPSAAYGAFTFLREPQMIPLALPGAARYSAGARDRGLTVVGNFLVDLSSPKERPADADLAQLVSALAPRADTRPFPRIAEFLPPDGLVRGSERYLLGPQATAQSFPAVATHPGDWIGFDKSAEAIVGHYRLKSQPRDVAVLVVIYPTPQIAAEQYASLNKWFTLNAEPGASGGHPAVFGTRTSALIALVTGIESREAASSLLGQVKYSSAITWNAPSYEIKDPSISTIVVGAIMDTGLLMVIALAAGVGFGGFRVFVKFLLPHKVFDRRENVEILQLGLGSKPIDAEDFYQ